MKHVDTIVLVRDLERSKTFYTQLLGMEILHDWGNMIVFKERFAIHQASALLPHDLISPHIHSGNQGLGNLILYFETEDLEGEYQKLLCAGVEMVHGIIDVPWQKLFRAYDPDGHILEIGAPFTPA